MCGIQVMKRFTFFVALYISAFTVSDGEAQLRIRHPLSDSDIEEALALGKESKTKIGLVLRKAGFDFAPMPDDSNRTGHVTQPQHRRSRQSTGFGVELYTPYGWLMYMGRDQLEKGREMYLRHVNENLRIPVLRILCFPDVPKNDFKGVYGKVITEVSLRSTKKNVEDVLPYSVERTRQELELPSGGVIDMGPLRGDFFLDEVQRLSALDKKGEFYVVVVSEDGKEEKFKIKSKHFKQLP